MHRGNRPNQTPRIPNNVRSRAPGLLRRRPMMSEEKTKIEEIETKMKNLTTGENVLTDYERFRRPRPESSLGPIGKNGISGKNISLLSNYFPITSYTNWCLYQYRVDFNPEEEVPNIKKGLLAQHRERLGGYLFDGSMLFSGSRFDPPVFNLTSTRHSDNQLIIITVKFTNVIETGDYANIQVFNLLLRNCLRHLNLTMIGRNFYDSQDKIDLSQFRFQLWPGYETTIGRYENNIMLCAEVSTKVMRGETVFDMLNQFANNRYKNKNWMIDFKNSIIGTSVMSEYNNKTYRIDDIDENVSPLSTFVKKDGSKITYMDYYKEKWKLTIYSVNQPMLITKNKRSIRQFGEEDTIVYLVPELCKLTGLSDVMRKDYKLMQTMAIHTRVNPTERCQRLINFANRLLKTPDSVNELKKWNLTLCNNLVKLTGRVLPFEKITSRCSSYNGGFQADWTHALRDKRMFTSATVNQWTIIAPEEYSRDVREFACMVEKCANKMNFKLPKANIDFIKNSNNVTTYLTQLDRILNDRNPILILCVINNSRTDLYNFIKRKLCVERAIPSQVVLLKTVTKLNMSICTKIAIQINCKLGGAPWFVEIPKDNMMIVGFDVCHDSQKKNLSFGALVATTNKTFTSYFNCVEPHQSGEEISVYFGSSMTRALEKYRAKNGILPTAIVIYRDGVEEGQISHVHKTEIKLLKEACARIYEGRSVPFTFVIVTKRINSRFFVPNDSNSNMENPPPGTVIDSVVTDPTKYDFFLISQHVKQGTVTPTHYQVIEDTLNFPPDILQRLTYKLTHMYYNWSGTVRVPAPCQLAHKLAFLAGQNLRGIPNVKLDELLYFL